MTWDLPPEEGLWVAWELLRELESAWQHGFATRGDGWDGMDLSSRNHEELTDDMDLSLEAELRKMVRRPARCEDEVCRSGIPGGT